MSFCIGNLINNRLLLWNLIGCYHVTMLYNRTDSLEKWWESQLHWVAMGYRLLHSRLVLVPIESVCIKVSLREIAPPTSSVVIPVHKTWTMWYRSMYYNKIEHTILHLHSVKIARIGCAENLSKSHKIKNELLIVSTCARIRKNVQITDYTHLPPEWVQMCTVPMEASSKVWSPSLHL